MPGSDGVVGVAGLGVVGSAVARWFQRQGRRVAVYDPPHGHDDPSPLREARVVFVCVPTPYGEAGYDATQLEAAVAAIPPGPAVVIKSTVLPGTTERLQARHPERPFLFNPEFLRERTADEDFVRPDRQIVGYTARSRKAAAEVLAMLPPASYRRLMPATEAELVKYMTNTFLAMKVVFANQFYDLCQRLGADYDLVREGAAADPRVGASHLDVWDGGERGYGGKCLPKDMKALIDFAASLGVPMRLLRTADALNEQLRSRQVCTAEPARRSAAMAETQRKVA
jgi:UDPglucose 6-dehydrogenase